MTTFEVGKKYYDTSACDHNCVFTTYRIRKENIMSQSTLQKLREGRPVSTEAIERLCLLLNCTPNDVMEIVR